MKKIIALLAFSFIGFAANAQSASTPAIDTATDAETINLVAPANYFKGADGTFAASIVATKISGTTGGTVYLQVSVDGTNYTNVMSKYGNYADTFVLANTAGAQVKNWFLPDTKVANARLRVVTSGTQSTQIKGYFIKK